MIRVGINGFGRIGRLVARIAAKQKNIKITAINSSSTPENFAYLLKYDSIHGTFPHKLKSQKESIFIDKNKILCFNEARPANIPWNKAKVDIVIESTGIFKNKKDASEHLGKSVKKVIITAPSKDSDLMVVMGVNHTKYNSKYHKIISNASCTTNCLAPVCKVLMDNFGIERGFMTTIHAVTSSQNILDNSHKKSKRLARTALGSIIPAETGASKALGYVIPKLKEKINSLALRVPVHNVSLIDLTVLLKKKASSNDINKAFIRSEKNDLSGILSVANDEMVSSDFIGSAFSAIVDPYLTSATGRWAKIFAWYDNEFGYASRVIDLINYIT